MKTKSIIPYPASSADKMARAPEPLLSNTSFLRALAPGQSLFLSDRRWHDWDTALAYSLILNCTKFCLEKNISFTGSPGGFGDKSPCFPQVLAPMHAYNKPHPWSSTAPSLWLGAEQGRAPIRPSFGSSHHHHHHHSLLHYLAARAFTLMTGKTICYLTLPLIPLRSSWIVHFFSNEQPVRSTLHTGYEGFGRVATAWLNFLSSPLWRSQGATLYTGAPKHVAEAPFYSGASTKMARSDETVHPRHKAQEKWCGPDCSPIDLKEDSI